MKLIKHFFIYSYLIFFYSCASIKPPPGGPVDDIPPQIIEVFPPSGTTNLKSSKIVLKFSEYMDEASFKNNIKVYPRLEKPLEFKFKGDEIILSLPNLLDSTITYIFYLNRNIKDEHGIPLANTEQLAYSTGDKISSGTIGGKIYGHGQKSVHLWKINDTKTDSIFAIQPDYITDVSKEGFYSFRYLTDGEYKILVVDKSGAGQPLNANLTAHGLYWENTLKLEENDSLSNIDMRLWKEPQKLKLLRGEWSAFNFGKLIFNIDLPENIVAELIIKKGKGTTADSLRYYQDSIDPKILIFEVADSIKSNSILAYIKSLRSNNELLLDSSEILIQIPQKPDTSFLQILKPTQNYQIIPNKLDVVELELIFSKPIQLSENSIYLPKLFKNDSIPVNINIKQINPMHYQLVPLSPWSENEKYKLEIDKRGVLSGNSKGLKDSVSMINLHTTKSIGFGTVSGKISELKQLNIVVELFSVKSPSLSQTSFVNSDSKFEFSTVPEDNYSLYFFRDFDKDMKYSYGKAYQDIPSEWFYFYPDTFEVRANWETELVPIKLPEVK